MRPDEHGERQRLGGHGAVAVLVHGRGVEMRAQLLVHAEFIVLRPERNGEVKFNLEKSTGHALNL